MATYSNYLVYKIFEEAGVPAGVIQFVPGPAERVVGQAIEHPSFAALHFTGSTFIFKKLWKDIAANLDKYKGYPRIVGETGQMAGCVSVQSNIRSLQCIEQVARTSISFTRLPRSGMPCCKVFEALLSTRVSSMYLAVTITY